MKIIEIIVSPAGETRIEAEGFAGAECQHASRFLEQALGTTSCEKLTGEFHHVSHNNQIHEQQ